MFKIAFFCDDKKLADALRGLTGLATGSPEVHPVINGTKKNGKVVAAGSGDLVELFAKYAKASRLTECDAKALTGFCRKAGLAPASRGYMIKRLLDAGALKKHGKGSNTSYTVNL